MDTLRMNTAGKRVNHVGKIAHYPIKQEVLTDKKRSISKIYGGCGTKPTVHKLPQCRVIVLPVTADGMNTGSFCDGEGKGVCEKYFGALFKRVSDSRRCGPRCIVIWVVPRTSERKTQRATTFVGLPDGNTYGVTFVVLNSAYTRLGYSKFYLRS
ncbi:hypothetical protein T265_05954 [Opisthorchis viverrini]|uniref:Uncharacterized protein n=1 Tax=Opisthorchis viverrini TaxID=6198 RepID=A0A074ZHX2_OPIVI|nr:hypothetical protein T265_05954 [Opisthorchis viverrini]KER26898.1 hypothetical protein T265_05954 [Opisthorchis viverrini]